MSTVWTYEPFVSHYGELTLSDSEIPTYSSTVAVAPVANPTDVIALICPNGTGKFIRPRKIVLTAQATAAWGPVLIQCLMRTTLNTGGFPATAGTMPHNTAVAATGSVVSYSANPAALGTSTAGAFAFYLSGNTTMYPPLTYTYDVGYMAPRMAANAGLYLNFGGVAMPAGFFIGATFVWSEWQ